MQIFNRIKLRLQAGLLTSRHVRFLHTNLWPFHSTGVCREKFWSLSCSWWPGLAESQIILGFNFCTFTKLKRQKVTGPTEKMCKLDLLHQLFSWHTSSLWIISWLKSGAGRRWSQALKYNVRLFTGACFRLWNLAALPEGLAITFTAQAGETGAPVGVQVSASPVWWRLTWRSRSTAGFYSAIMVPIILQWWFRAATLYEYRVSPTKKLTHSGAPGLLSGPALNQDHRYLPYILHHLIIQHIHGFSSPEWAQACRVCHRCLRAERFWGRPPLLLICVDGE